MIVRRAQPEETTVIKQWVAARHYLKSTPPGFVFILEFLDPSGKERWGAMIFGRPTARQYDADRVLELTRMYFVDDTPQNTESRALGMARSFIRRWYPQIRLVLAYADPSNGHKGTIYEADNWAPFGMTKESHGYGWSSREAESRQDTQVASKMRWVRTP